jgi:hypothetical protein
VKVYLLLISRERFFFYSDESEASHDEREGDDSSAPARPGLRGWLRDRYMRFKSAWHHADAGAVLWMRRAWDWLHSFAHPDEAMLARLRWARRIELHHPATRPGDQVRLMWRDYLTQQWRRHLIWMSINGVIAPFSVVFAILPGPNLIGYWFAYRAIHHLLVVWGIARVRRNTFLTELQPLAALDVPIEHQREGKARHAALTSAAVRLDEHVVWHESSRGTRSQGRLSVPTSTTELEPAPNRPEEPQDV